MNYTDLTTALGILGIAKRATLSQIKARHRELVKKHHPDQAGDNDAVDIRKINAAYEVLMTYCANYKYSFSESEFLEQVPEERLRRQFGWDPVWGGNREDE